MYEHHRESLRIMTEYFRGQEGIIALIFDGSVARGVERPDSDLDAVVIVTEERYEEQRAKNRLAETITGYCTYEGGYFDVKYKTKGFLELAAACGSEPTRASFYKARVLFSSDPEIERLLNKINTFPVEEREQKYRVFYANVWLNQCYFMSCIPEKGNYMRMHIVSEIVYSIYRMILEENEVLFPCNRRLEEYVDQCGHKPDRILELAEAFMERMDQESCDAFVNAWKKWTSWTPPEDIDSILSTYVGAYEEWWLYERSPFVNEW